jgi:hypothetical protein
LTLRRAEQVRQLRNKWERNLEKLFLLLGVFNGAQWDANIELGRIKSKEPWSVLKVLPDRLLGKTGETHGKSQPG